MSRKWKDVKKRRLPGEDAEIEARVRAELAKLPEKEILRAHRMTRQRLAEILELDREQVARIERRADIYLGTLRSYIEAQGGTLELSARFAGGELILQSFHDPLPSGPVSREAEQPAAEAEPDKEAAAAPAA